MPLTARPRLAPRLRLALAVAAAGALVFAPAAALACPQCAMGRDGGPAQDLLVAGMMLSPFVVAIAVFRTVARILRGRKSDSSAPGEEDEQR